jgi:hypothetical protein
MDLGNQNQSVIVTNWLYNAARAGLVRRWQTRIKNPYVRAFRYLLEAERKAESLTKMSATHGRCREDKRSVKYGYRYKVLSLILIETMKLRIFRLYRRFLWSRKFIHRHLVNLLRDNCSFSIPHFSRKRFTIRLRERGALSETLTPWKTNVWQLKLLDMPPFMNVNLGWYYLFNFGLVQRQELLWCKETHSGVLSNKKQQTPWLQSASELYPPSDRRLSAKLVPTFAERGCLVVRATNPHGR